MTDIQKVIKHIRGISTKPLVITDPVDARIAEAKAQMAMGDIYDSQVEIIRDRNFRLAQDARQRNIEARKEEERRQEEIATQRLKNLVRARKALRKMRLNESQS